MSNLNNVVDLDENYVRVNELTDEEIKKLPVIGFKLSRVEYQKSGSIKYCITFRLPGVEVMDSIKNGKYSAIKCAYGDFTDGLLSRKAYYRIITGTDKNNHPYNQVQLIFKHGLSYTHMLSDLDLKNLIGFSSAAKQVINRVVNPGTAEFEDSASDILI
jgi:hypothetical protein